MKIIVKTVSGSIYQFTQKENRFFFIRGTLSGEVVKMNNRLKVGQKLDFSFYKEGLYCTPQSIPMFLKSSPIQEIVVSF